MPVLEFWLTYVPLVLLCVAGAVASSRALGGALEDRAVLAAQEVGDQATLAVSEVADAPALTPGWPGRRAAVRPAPRSLLAPRPSTREEATAPATHISTSGAVRPLATVQPTLLGSGQPGAERARLIVVGARMCQGICSCPRASQVCCGPGLWAECWGSSVLTCSQADKALIMNIDH